MTDAKVTLVDRMIGHAERLGFPAFILAVVMFAVYQMAAWAAPRVDTLVDEHVKTSEAMRETVDEHMESLDEVKRHQARMVYLLEQFLAESRRR